MVTNSRGMVSVGIEKQRAFIKMELSFQDSA
ncbi:hypothetical protein QFZ28_005940 [Neobacillus niacini]|nr:hypothetical protein [Neobacillus niacini]